MVLLEAEGWPPRVVRAWRGVPVEVVVAAVMRLPPGAVVVCEWLTSYGTAVGASTLDTARMVGRIEQVCSDAGVRFKFLLRPEVGLELCQSSRAKSGQIAEAIRDIYRRAGLATGGGSDPCRGTVKQPGPLFGLALSQHEGSALAVALAWIRMGGAT